MASAAVVGAGTGAGAGAAGLGSSAVGAGAVADGAAAGAFGFWIMTTMNEAGPISSSASDWLSSFKTY